MLDIYEYEVCSDTVFDLPLL